MYLNFIKYFFPYFFILFLSCNKTNAQDYMVIGAVKDNEGTSLAFANIVFKNDSTLLGVVSDSAGNFNLSLNAANYIMSVSLVGYNTLNKKIVIDKNTNLGSITLSEDYMGTGEVIISANLKETYLLASPVKVSVYSAKFIQQTTPAMGLMETLKLMNGLQENNACGVCNTNSISINGLPPAYTAILIDGTPAYGNLASVYGLNGIPINIIERIEVSKGPNSTLYGTEAMAGTVNVVTKDPACQPIFSIDIIGSSDLDLNSNLSFSTKILGQKLLAGFQHAYSNFYEDRNNDGFGDNLSLNRLSIFSKLSGKIGNKLKYQNFVKYLYEDRINGVETYFRNSNLRGNDSIYGEGILTNRFEFLGNFELPFKEKIRTDYSFSLHRQNSYYGADFYEAIQSIAYINTIWNKKVKKHDLMSGLTFRAQYYDDNTFVTADSLENKPDIQLVPGIWLQDEWEIISNTLTIMPGFRVDYYNRHGLIPSPRLNIKYKPSLWWTMRLNVGTGFRIVNLFAEDHAFVSGQRRVVLEEKLNPEQSYSANLNINYVFTVFGGQGSIDTDAYYNYLDNAIFPDYSSQNLLIYRNLKGYANIFGTSLTLNYSFKFPLSFNLGLNFLNASEVSIQNAVRNSDKLLFSPDYTALFNLNYRWKRAGLSFTYSMNLTGPMSLPEVFDLDIYGNPLSTARPERSAIFSIHNLQIIKNIGKRYSCYAGIQNIFNYIQSYSPLSAYNDPAFSSGFSPFFDTSYNYGTIQGREFFIGFRMNIEKNKI